MDDTNARLAKCFRLVFPELAVENVEQASVQTVARWDSLAQIKLLSLIGQEFSIDVDFDEFQGAISFSAIRDRIDALVRNA